MKSLKAKEESARKLYQCRGKNFHLSYCIYIVCMLAHVHKKNIRKKGI